MPTGLDELGRLADAEGVGSVRAVVGQWLDGSHRYTAPGESLLVAVADEHIVGVGGISLCPDVAGALRVRRFYIAPGWRRRGVAKALASRLIAGAQTHTDTITCNAQASSAAPPFWESLGFMPARLPGITHQRTVCSARVGSLL
jgi:GNAT superfamily N-acetyltransferase